MDIPLFVIHVLKIKFIINHFHSHGLNSTSPLELIYTNAWGPCPDIGIDDSKYYIIFIDHYTKYIWLYPM